VKQLFLNRNEILDGPAPKVLEVIRKFNAGHISRYLGDYYNSLLIPAISKKLNISPDRVIISYGIEDFLRTAFNQLDKRKDCVLLPKPCYSLYTKYLQHRRIRISFFELREGKDEFEFDIDAMRTKIRHLKPKIVLITSPNNPTGNSISASELARVSSIVDKNSLILIDQEYLGFDISYRDSKFLTLVRRFPNLVLLRSFSKLHSLAGLRIGFALCGSKVKDILGYQNYYLGFSRILEEVAMVAMESDAYYKRIGRRIIKDRERLWTRINKLRNFHAYCSQANFLFIKAKGRAKILLKSRLAQEQVVIAKYIENNFFRVSIDLVPQLKRFYSLLKAIDKSL